MVAVDKSAKKGIDEIHILWISEGLSCDGDTVSITAASQPSIEDIVLGLIPGIPKVHLHNKVLAYETGEDYLKTFRAAARGELGPFVLVIEGSIPNENINGEGYWTSFGNDERGEPITLNTWLDALAPRAWAVVAAGTCATYGGIHAMAGNPTGCMGLADYLGWDFRSTGGAPDRQRPGLSRSSRTTSWRRCSGCSAQAAGHAPMIPLDEQLRPTWLFGKTVHEGCDRAGYYEQADFAADYNSPKCQVKIGCWGPVVNCNVPKRGWMAGIGGCPNVGGICIGCTMPGFPDKFMPFMDEPPGATLSAVAARRRTGASSARLRGITNHTANEEPKWHHNGPALTSGYDLHWRP